MRVVKVERQVKKRKNRNKVKYQSTRKRYSKKPVSKSEGLLILDQFSSSDVERWSDAEKNITEYHNSLFSALEAQRRMIYDELCSALLSSSNIAHSFDNYSRIIDYRRGNEPLQVSGYKFSYGGRFNYGMSLDPHHFHPYPAMYLASTVETAMKEKYRITCPDSSGLSVEDFALIKPSSVVVLNVIGQLQNVFDLRSPDTLKGFIKLTKEFSIASNLFSLAKKIGIPAPSVITTHKSLWDSLLDEDWRVMPAQLGLPSNSQVFGKLLRDAKFEGVLFNSTRGAGECLAIFVENLNDESYVELTDDPPRTVLNRRLDKNTLKALL
jgi:RES domain